MRSEWQEPAQARTYQQKQEVGFYGSNDGKSLEGFPFVLKSLR